MLPKLPHGIYYLYSFTIIILSGINLLFIKFYLFLIVNSFKYISDQMILIADIGRILQILQS